MKINGNGDDKLRGLLDSLSRTQQGKGAERGRTAAAGSESGAAAGDRVDLSGVAQDFARLRQSIDALPELREDAVASLRDVVLSGRYVVDDQRLADRLAEELTGGLS